MTTPQKQSVSQRFTTQGDAPPKDLNPNLDPDLDKRRTGVDAPRSGDSLELQNERKEVPVPLGLGSDVNYLTKGAAPDNYEPLHPVATTEPSKPAPPRPGATKPNPPLKHESENKSAPKQEVENKAAPKQEPSKK